MRHKVRMLQTVPGSYDGYTPVTWHRGHVYDDITDELLRNFIAMGAVEIVEDKPEPVTLETKPARKKGRGYAI